MFVDSHHVRVDCRFATFLFGMFLDSHDVRVESGRQLFFVCCLLFRRMQCLHRVADDMVHIRFCSKLEFDSVRMGGRIGGFIVSPSIEWMVS